MKKLEKFMQYLRAVLWIFIYRERKREIMYTLCAQFNLQWTNGVIKYLHARFVYNWDFLVCINMLHIIHI